MFTWQSDFFLLSSMRRKFGASHNRKSFIPLFPFLFGKTKYRLNNKNKQGPELKFRVTVKSYLLSSTLVTNQL